MSFAGWKEFWWNSVTGPHTMITKVVDFLLEKNTVALIVPDYLPWQHDYRSAVEMAFKQKALVSNLIFHQVNAIDDYPSDVEPGRYLLQRFASAEIYKAYREKAGIPLQTYLIQNAVLKNAVVWLRGLTATQAAGWIKFCRGYAPPTIEDGLIILEICEDVQLPDVRRMKIVSFADSVSNYDLQLFNSFVLDSSSRYTEMWKQYISTVAARLCDIDAEISAKLISMTDFKSEEPLDGIRKIDALPKYERRGQKSNHHVLACLRAGCFDELNNRIWSAQVQALFPIIELERMDTVHNWRSEIQRALDSYPIVQYNKKLTDPFDMELGTLAYHLSHKADMRNYYIYIPDEATRNRIRFLHECRNILAHVKCLSVAQVNGLIDGTAVGRAQYASNQNTPILEMRAKQDQPSYGQKRRVFSRI